MPWFKKSGGRIFGVQFNKAEQAAVNREIYKQLVENDERFDIDKEAAILCVLHTRCGYGKKKLRELWQAFYEETLKLRKRYELGPDDDGWLARENLLAIGVDLAAWYREELHE